MSESKKRQSHNAQFKAKVGLEAIQVCPSRSTNQTGHVGGFLELNLYYFFEFFFMMAVCFCCSFSAFS